MLLGIHVLPDIILVLFVFAALVAARGVPDGGRGRGRARHVQEIYRYIQEIAKLSQHAGAGQCRMKDVHVQ